MSAVVRPRGFVFDPALVAAVIGLAVLGAIMIGSASIARADREHGEPFYFLLHHLAALGIGSALLALTALVPSDFWRRASWLMLALGLGVLVLVLVPALGRTANGSTRWLLFGPVSFQASELARLMLLVYLASYAVRRGADLAASWKGFIKPMAVVVIAAVLLLREPDFGAAAVLMATSLGILFVGGARLRDLLLAALASGGGMAALAYASPERVERMTSFMNPWVDAGDSGFQLTQSLMAIGRGEWFGVGLGESVQKLFYLPEAHTDFVFAVLAEELGFAGATVVIALFGLIVFRAVTLGQLALRSGQTFQGLLAIGIGLMLGLEALINIGVNAGLLPTKGLALPLVSYGRSSTVVTLIAFGLLIRVYHELHGGQKRLPQRGQVR